MGKALYREITKKYGERLLPKSKGEHRQVQRVLERLVLHSGLDDISWEVNVIEDAEMCAFVLSTGQVFLYRGLLDFCIREDEVAVILGHEIAHIIHHHVSESLSWGIALAPVAVGSALASGISADLVDLAVDVAFKLPRKRAQEEEADYFGLLLTAKKRL